MPDKIYFICHEFSPDQGSECKSGWNTAIELNKLVDLTIVAAETNQWGTKNYKRAVEGDPNAENLNIIWIPQPKKFTRPKGFGSNIFVQAMYFWRLRSWNSAVIKELKRHEIAVLHYFNHISFRAYDRRFSSLAPKIVIGPVSGTQILPAGFLKFGFIYNCNLAFRSVANFVQRLVKRNIFKSKNISTIFAVTKDDVSYFKNIHNRVIPLSDMAQDISCDEREEIDDELRSNAKINLLWVGRLDNLKCLDILLEVFIRNSTINNRFELTVLGDGANFFRYQEKIDQHNLSISLKGSVPFHSVKDFMRRSDLMVHSSLKEAGGAVVSEALSNRLPVMCHDSFGFAIHFDDRFMIKIPFISYENSVNEFHNQLANIAQDRGIISELLTNIDRQFKPVTWRDHAVLISDEYK